MLTKTKEANPFRTFIPSKVSLSLPRPPALQSRACQLALYLTKIEKLLKNRELVFKYGGEETNTFLQCLSFCVEVVSEENNEFKQKLSTDICTFLFHLLSNEIFGERKSIKVSPL